MKFYLTAKNEKGKIHGIGGNEYLDIDIRAGNKLIAMFTLRENEDGDYTLFDEDDEPVNQSYVVKSKKHDPRTCENSIPCFDCMEIEQPQEWARQMKIIKGKKQKMTKKNCCVVGCNSISMIGGEYCEYHHNSLL